MTCIFTHWQHKINIKLFLNSFNLSLIIFSSARPTMSPIKAIRIFLISHFKHSTIIFIKGCDFTILVFYNFFRNIQTNTHSTVCFRRSKGLKECFKMVGFIPPALSSKETTISSSSSCKKMFKPRFSIFFVRQFI